MHALSSDTIRRRVDAELARLVDQKLKELPDEAMAPWLQVLRTFVVEGGKRMRAVFCCLGFCGAGGDAGAPSVIAAAAALELFQDCLLIQDDIMDRSQLRRGRPTLHRQLAAWKSERGDASDADAFGQSSALIFSDLCLGWAWELGSQSIADPQRAVAVRALFDRMLIDVNYGQGLELLLTAERGFFVNRGLTVARYKTGTYTIEGPLQVGAALAGAAPELHRAYADFAFPAGEAFQLRDDLLGVFGPPDSTGKSNIDDLREGKPTVLFSLALERASAAQAARLRSQYGRPELDSAGAAELRELIRATGAVAAVEEMIEERARRALAGLEQAPMDAGAREALAALIKAALYRDR
jgi:geranylgeranyl diphosphate synthase type I